MIPKNQEDIKPDDGDSSSPDLEDRKKDYSGLAYIQKQLSEIYSQIEKAFEDKTDQNDTIDECWDAYHCKTNENQSYQPMGKPVYVPIIRDALTARETRFVNMLFAASGRYADVVGNDGKVPYDLIALLDYYVRRAKLRQIVAPALIRTGDITGQYALYMDWITHERCVTSKTKKPEMTTEDDTPIDGAPEYDDIDYEEDVDEYPGVTVLDPRNLVVLPVSADSIENAEIIDVVLPFSKGKIKKWIKKGIFEKSAGETLLRNMATAAKNKLPDTRKKAAMAAGVKLDSKGNATAMVHQVWCKLKIKGEYRMMVTHFGDSDLILGCKRNPYWSDRIPVISQAAVQNPDTLWGASQVEPVLEIQYKANDVANEGFDSAQYALMPIVMTDPEKNPRAGSMVLAMASVWLTDPNSTKFAEFPKLWQDAFSIIGACKEQIFQSLGVNPAMMPMGGAGKKPTQAQIAQEQQVMLETTADNVALIQEGILGEVLQWFYELDYQYRTKPVTVKKFGQLGLQADMDQVELFQERQRYEFKWYGTEGFKAVQQVQQMISLIGVLTKLPPQALNGRKLDLGPVMEFAAEATFGPRIAPHVLIDQRHQLGIDPQTENQLIDNLFPVQVHEMDNDQQHIMAHMAHFGEVLKLHPHEDKIAELARGHILMHMQQMKAKMQASMGAQPGQVGAPGQPKAGAQIQPPTGPQQPAGAVHPDNMPTAMPRRAVV